jgi:uncharacterized protein
MTRGAWTYHAARIGGYAAFGAVFGGIGQAFDLGFGVTVSKLLPYALVTALLVSAFDIGRWVRVPTRLSQMIGRRLSLPVALGALTPLIPCGFLYATVPIAIATGSALKGSTALVAFALGTAPMLVAVSLAGSRRKLVHFSHFRRVALVIAALVVAGRTFVLEPARAGEAPAHTCHQH